MGLKKIISTLLITAMAGTGCVSKVYSDTRPSTPYVKVVKGENTASYTTTGTGLLEEKKGEDKTTTVASFTVGSYKTGLLRTIEPNPTDKNLEVYANKLVEALTASKECKKVYIAKMQTQAGKHTLVVCEGKKKDLVPKYRINLNDICDVSLHEHFGMFEWMRGDDVAVKTKHGSVYTMRLWDKHAKNVYNVLSEYLNTIKTTEGGAKCLR
jgi:hypothetical protein